MVVRPLVTFLLSSSHCLGIRRYSNVRLQRHGNDCCRSSFGCCYSWLAIVVSWLAVVASIDLPLLWSWRTAGPGKFNLGGHIQCATASSCRARYIPWQVLYPDGLAITTHLVSFACFIELTGSGPGHVTTVKLKATAYSCVS